LATASDAPGVHPRRRDAILSLPQNESPMPTPHPKLPRPYVGLLLLAACAATLPPPALYVEPEGIHLGDDWFTYRARGLGITADAARQRDAALPTDHPAAGIWDQQTAAEAVALWAGRCAACHGPHGRGEGVPAHDPAPRAWGGMGAAMGFFFGGDAMRAGVYRKIAEGGGTVDGKVSDMPAWGGELSREQMWALVRFIEEL